LGQSFPRRSRNGSLFTISRTTAENVIPGGANKEAFERFAGKW
jgi:hypothetical protein